MTHEIKYEGYVYPTTADLVNVFSMMDAASYWCDVCFDEKEYKAAQEFMKNDPYRHDEICYEDVLVCILETGGALDFYDDEEDEHHEIKLSTLLDGIGQYVAWSGKIDPDDWDGESTDTIMQYAALGEIVYG